MVVQSNTSSISESGDDLKVKLKLLDVAIRLRKEFNLCIIPSGQFRNDAYKSPWVSWAEYNQPGAALPTEQQIRDWNSIYHPTLWGFVTGQISGITVFDADSLETVKLFHDAGLEPHCKTKKGEHFYFKYPGQQFDHLIYTIAGVIPHVDIRSAGGFVNCLGRNSTASYQMLKSPADLYDIKQLPQPVIDGIGRLQEKKTAGQTSEFTNEGETIPDGSQNEWLFHRACGYRKHGDTEEMIFQKIKLDLLRCPQTKNHPFTDIDLMRIAKSAARYKPTKYEPKSLIIRGGIPL